MAKKIKDVEVKEEIKEVEVNKEVSEAQQLFNKNLKITMDYNEIITGTIQLKTLGVGQFLNFNVNELTVKVVHVNEIDSSGIPIEGVYCWKLNTILKNNETQDVISTFSATIARWAVNLFNAMGVGIDAGYCKVSGIELSVKITKELKNNKNIYRVTNKTIGVDNFSVESLALDRVKAFTFTNKLMIE
jgi:hypothetical protein